jgi:hypothetical protein
MAFVLSVSPTYEWPVELSVPTDGGKRRKFNFRVVFNRLSQSQNDDLMLAQQELKSMAQSGIAGPVFETKFREVRGHAAEVLAGWVDVKAKDDDPEPLPVTRENMSKFLDFPGMATALVQAYAESIEDAKRGN